MPRKAASKTDDAPKRDWDAPSRNPDFLGATPGDIARALLRPIRALKPNPAAAKKEAT